VPHPVTFIDELPGLRERLARATILYTDLDGTLLGRGASLLSDGTGRPTLDGASAVADLNGAGLTVAIVSGRNARQLLEVSRILGWSDFIAEVGAIRSYDRGTREVVDTGTWPEGTVLAAESPYETIVRAGAIDCLRSRFDGLIEYHDPWHRDRAVTHVLRGNVDVRAAQAALDTLPVAITLVDNGIIHPPRHTLVGVDEVHAYHLVPTGVSKQNAIAADLAQRGLERDDAIAIGDSVADLGMAGSVGLMVVVNNGLDDPALLAAAGGCDGARIAATRRPFGAGWRELADAWLDARA
jgi:hydroxymethylpyrimidine pyrophosphatase-like HAD family hydrolase